MLANAVGHGMVDKAKSLFTTHNLIMVGIAGLGITMCIVGIALVSKHNGKNNAKKSHTAGAIVLIVGLLTLAGEFLWWFHNWHEHHKAATHLQGHTEHGMATVMTNGAKRAGGGMFASGKAEAEAGNIQIPGLFSNGSSSQARDMANTFSAPVPDSAIKAVAKEMGVPGWMANKSTMARAMSGMLSAPGGANAVKALGPWASIMKSVI